jgi:hypothetical protein
VMVEGGDRTDRSSACGGSSNYGREPDGPEEFNWNQGPERPSKSVRDCNSFPAPRLTALDEVRQDVATRALRGARRSMHHQLGCGRGRIQEAA